VAAPVREAPQDVAAERVVLGSILVDSNAIEQVGDLTAEDFWLARHGAVYRAALACHAEYGCTEIAVVLDYLKSHPETADVAGDPGAIVDLLDDGRSGLSVAVHAAIVASKARARRAINIAVEAQRRLYEGESIDDVVLDLQIAIDQQRSSRAVRLEDLCRPLACGMLSTPPEPRKWLFRHPTRDGVPCDDGFGDGLFPLGRVGVLSAAGGAGKTMAIMQAAVSVVTGRPLFGHFTVGAEARGKKVLLLLGEEKTDEVHRRLYTVAETLCLTEHEKALVEQRVIVGALSGQDVRLTTVSSSGVLARTPNVETICRMVDGGGFALVGIDPLSRFAGGDMDKSNADATFFVQALERISDAGNTSTLCDHHTSKVSRRDGKAESRGATGLPDAARWEATLIANPDETVVKFQQTKSNYSIPMRKPVLLVRERGGVLRVETPAEVEAAEEEQRTAQQYRLEADIAAVVEVLRQNDGPMAHLDAIAAKCGIPKARCRAAIHVGASAKRILLLGSTRDRSYDVPGRMPRGTSG